MKIISSTLLVGFISLALFGFIGMLASGNMMHASNACLASLAQNMACPPPENSVAAGIFHTNAFKVFSTTTLSLTFVFLSIAFLFAGFVKPGLEKAFAGARILAFRIDEFISRYLALKKLKLALVRFERSPTL